MSKPITKEEQDFLIIALVAKLQSLPAKDKAKLVAELEAVLANLKKVK